MGAIHVTVSLRASQKSSKKYEAIFLVDTGTTDSMAPASKLKQAGIRRSGRMSYELADGTTVEYDFGLAVIEFMGELTAGRIIFGPDDCEPLLGVTALESVGITVDPTNRQLKRLPAIPLKAGLKHPRGNGRMLMHKDFQAYNAAQSAGDKRICDALAKAIDRHLPGAESKIWHGHSVWFLDGNPIVGYSKLKDCIRLLFWSGQSFDEPGLAAEGSFKAAEARYTSDDQIAAKDLKRWIQKSIEIQWDYKNIVKRKGKLERLK